MILFIKEILRIVELYSLFIIIEEDLMNNEFVGGFMSNVSVVYCNY